jgi:hypothetical protein
MCWRGAMAQESDYSHQLIPLFPDRIQTISSAGRQDKNLRVKCEVTPPLVAFLPPLAKTLDA